MVEGFFSRRGYFRTPRLFLALNLVLKWFCKFLSFSDFRLLTGVLMQHRLYIKIVSFHVKLFFIHHYFKSKKKPFFRLLKLISVKFHFLNNILADSRVVVYQVEITQSSVRKYPHLRKKSPRNIGV